jgi:hypothetical protein
MLTKQHPRAFGADAANVAAGQCILLDAHTLISAPHMNGKRFFVRNAMPRSSAAQISKDSPHLNQ